MAYSTTTISLPGGLWLDGVRHREATLCLLSGDDEAFLLETGGAFLFVQRTTALLARCTRRLRPLSPVTAAAIASLTAGDREARLLTLRERTSGPALSLDDYLEQRNWGRR